MDSDGIPSIPDREAVRALAERHSAAIRDATEAGGNAHQLSIDIQDEVDRFVATLDVSLRPLFLEMYTQEITALVQHTREDVAEADTHLTGLQADVSEATARATQRQSPDSMVARPGATVEQPKEWIAAGVIVLIAFVALVIWMLSW